jgi:predicted permease
MSWMSWSRFLRRSARERERAAEIQAHLDLYADQLVAKGRSPDEARREARLRFGNPRARREEVDQMNRLPVFDVLGRDLSYAIRLLRRTPAFTITTVSILGLVIGACTAVFSLANAILFEPPPYPDPERLAYAQVEGRSERGEFTQLGQDAASWEAIRDQVPSLDSAVYSGSFAGVNLVVGDRAAFVDQQRISAGYFRVLGVSPAMGREFTPDQDVPGGPALAIISHRLWMRELGGPPQILGETIRLRGDAYEVVGVMPESFDEVTSVEVWTPLRASRRGEGGGTNFMVVSRLRPDATWDQADAEMRAIGPEPLRERGLQSEAGVTAWYSTVPMHEVRSARSREPILMLGAAVTAVLLIACVNIAALLLARGSGRAKEIATRMALGSGRTAVIRQLMVESAVLGLIGGAVGVGVAYLGLAGLQQLGASTYGDWSDAAIDGRVLLVTGGLAVLTSLIFGLVPAIQASRFNVQGALAGGGTRAVAGGPRRWPRRVLVVSEVALGVALLVVSGLLIRTFVNIMNTDPGFEPDRLVTASVSLQDARYQTAGDINRLFDQSLEALRADPAVESAAISLQLPYTRLLNWGFRLPDLADENNTIVNVLYVSDGFFEAYGVPIRNGRGITAVDRAGSPPVAVVNETFVRVHGDPDRATVGRRIVLSGYPEQREIVGVVGDVQQTDSGFQFEGRVAGPLMTTPTMFIPASQTPNSFFTAVHTWFRPIWTIRTRPGSPSAGAISRAITRVDSLLPVGAETPVSAVIAEATAEERLMTTLVSVLAAAALLLAALGIHGLIAHSVSERTREFGIRLALGATPGRAMLRAASSGVVLAVIGVLVGGMLSLWGVNLVEGFLWGVGEHDPATWVGVGIFFVVVAGLASVIPAMRILRLDPAQTLRD